MLTLSTLVLLLSLSISQAASTLDIEPSQTRINYSPVVYTFTLRADSYTQIASGSTIQITFPSDYSSIFPASPSCNYTSGSLTCSGATSNRTVTVSSYFSSTITDKTFSFNIIGLSNPSHTGSTGTFTMSIISPSKSTLLSASSTVTITEGTATCSVSTTSNVLGASTQITFNITPSTLISANGGLEVTFPKWSSQGQSMVSSPSTVTCLLTAPASRTPGSCSMTTADTLTVTNIMTTSIQPGTVITMQFDDITNPPLTDPYTITIRTLDSNGLGVDQCTPTLQVSSPNKITVNQSNFLTCITNSNLKQINTIETCVLTFKTTNPLPKGAAINIVFPPEVGISSSLKVNEDSPVPISSLSITSSYPTIQLLNAVSVYTAASTEFDIRFISIQHPSTTKSTSSFQITTLVNGNPIDTITSGVTYSASPGDLSNVQITASPSQAGSTANMTFQFSLMDNVPTASQIQIVFPDEFSSGTSISCTGSGSNIVSSPTCSMTSNVLKVSNYASSNLTSGTAVSLTVKNIILPQSSAPTSAFDIITQQNGYSVDRNNVVTFAASPAIITSDNVALSIGSGAKVGGTSAYNITFQNVNPIPAAGQFLVTMPADGSVTIPGSSALGTGTQAVIKGSLTSFSTTVNSTAGTLLFTNPTNAVITSGTTIKILIPTLTNPSSTGSTSSFTVQTLTADSYTIDSILTGLSVSANTISVSNFSSAEIDPMPSGAGQTSAYNVTFIPQVLESATDVLVITFPSNYTFASTVTCTIMLPQQQAAFNCNPTSNKITISLGQQVQAQQAFEVDISGVINPGTAGSYSGFSLATKTSDGYSIHQTLSGLGVTISTLICPANCKTCTSPTQCTECVASSTQPYLYDGSCTNQCPDGTVASSSRACVDKPQIVGNPYTGVYISGLPFPFLIFGLIFSVLSFVGRMVSDSSLVISNIIGFFSLLEWAAWITFMALLHLSHPDDSVSDYPGYPLTIVGFIIALGLNIVFYIKVIRPIMKEESIVNWMKEKKSHQVVGIVGQGLVILSFKSFRLVYSRFFGLEPLSVQIPKPKAFASNLNKFTGVNFFFSVLFVLIGAIVTLNKDSDLPQLLRISIEILIISLLTTVLTIYDALSTNEAESKANVLAAQSQVLSILGKSIVDKLNESIEAGTVDLKRFTGMKNRAYKKRSSLNLDSSNEFNESELHGLDAPSFLKVNSSFNRLGQSIDYKRNDESFTESADGHPERIHDISRIQAIKENEEEDDEEPAVYSRNTIFAGSRNELNPDRIIIENKDGSITHIARDSKRAKQSPTKAQMKSSRREMEENQRNSAVVYGQVTNRQLSSRSKIDEEGGIFALKERSGNTASKEQALKSGAKKGKKESDSEDELELHDDAGGRKVLRDYMQEAHLFPVRVANENTESARGERKTTKEQERYDKSGKKEQQTLESYRLSNAYTSPSKTKRGQPSQRTAEKGRRGGEENDRTMEVEDYDIANKGSAKKDNFMPPESYLSGRKNTGFSAKKGTPFKSPYKTGNYTGGDFASPLKSGTKAQPHMKTPERQPGSQLDYVSSGSQSPGEDRDEYFQDDTPNNYNALNQRYEEELVPSSTSLQSRVFELVVHPTEKPQKDSPQKPTIMQNFTGEKEEQRPHSENILRDYPLKAHSRGEVDRPGTTYHDTRLSLNEKGSGKKRIGTPQTYTNEVRRAIEYRGHLSGPPKRRTMENFVKEKKKEEQNEEEKDPDLHFGRITEKEKQEKLDRLESIYSSQKKPKRKLRSTGSKRKAQGSQNSIDDNMAEQGVDHQDLEISNFGKFEDFVNEMKIHGESDENADPESFRPEDM